MPEMRSYERGRVFNHESEHPPWQSAPARRSEPESGGISAGLMLAGIAALALGAWAVYHFGPDFRRYIKMEMM